MRIRMIAVALLAASTAYAATPLITLDYPRGGEVFVVGTTQRVVLSSKIKPKSVKVELSRDGGANFETLGTITVDKKKLPPKLAFTVAGAPSNTSVIRVSDAANPGVFAVSATFAIATSVGAGQLVIPDGFVNSVQLADGSVTNPKLAALAVTSDKVSSGQASPNFILSADGLGGAAWAALPAVNAVPSFTGLLLGDVTGTQSATVVSQVGGVSAGNIASGANLANNAASANTANAIVKRDGGGNFSAGTISASLTGNVTGNVTGDVSGNAAGFTGNLIGDVTGAQSATAVRKLQGTAVSAAAPANNQILQFNSGSGQWVPTDLPPSGGTVTNVSASAPLTVTNPTTTPAISLGIVPVANGGTGSNAQNFVDLTTAQTINGVKTFGSTIGGNINGTAGGFTGSLAGDVTGTQNVTVVSQVGGVTAANLASGANLANDATSGNVASTIIRRDASGNFSAVTIAANLTGSVTGNVSGTSAGFTGALAGDVTGAQGATVVSTVGGVTAANIGTGANLANSATNANTANAIIKRDGSGNFSAGTIAANLIGNASGTAGGFTGSLAGDVTGTQGATAVAQVGGVTAANVGTGANLANSATNANTANAIVKRDESGNFSAGTITANLTGNVSGTASGFTGSLAGDVTGTQGATVVSAVGGVTAANVGAGATLANNATNANTANAIVERDASGNFSAGTITANLSGNVSGNVSGTAANVSGVVEVDHGGTGQTSYTNGQILIGNSTANTLTKGTLDGTANQINVTNGTGTITLSTPQDLATTSNAAFASVTAATSVSTPAVNSTAAQLDIQLAGTRAMRFVPAAAPGTNAPSIIGGGANNSVTAGAQGALIAGGGTIASPNTVTDNYGTIGGGLGNQAGDNNAGPSDSTYATVAGGVNNLASAIYAAVGGGNANSASGGAATISGGDSNTAAGQFAAVPGGQSNAAAGDYSFAAGRRARVSAAHDGSFLFADQSNFDFNSTVANEFAARATGGARFVTAIDGGGNATQVVSFAPSANAAVVASNGVLDVRLGAARAMRLIPAAAPNTDAPGIIEGFAGNSIGTGVKGGTIGGGGSSGANLNTVLDDYGTISGGFRNSVGDGAGTTADRIGAAVGGGNFNIASATYSTIGGGQSNSMAGAHGVIAGGLSNLGTGTHATIGGGRFNQTDGFASVVAGGDSNFATTNNATVSGGINNQATGIYATVVGGIGNTSSGTGSVAAGGQSNVASGDYSFAAGFRGNVTHFGSFMFSDLSNFNFSSIASNEFAARAIGGVRFVTAINASGVPTKTFTIDGSGNAYVQGDLHVDGADTNGGTQHPGLTLGGEFSGSTITSNRTTGAADGIGNKFGIDLYTNNARRMSITQSGGVGIGSSPVGTNVILELTSTTRAFVLPRMTRAQRNLIASPFAGMVIYQNDNTPGLRVYNGTNWMRFTETAD